MSSPAAGNNRAFHLRQNTLTGESEWVVIEGNEDVESNAAPRPLLAATSYLDMLNDCRRNRAFRLAIEKAISGPCHVLDIGAGTGLLSMMAARAMTESGVGGEGMVSACESFLPMVKLMRRVLRDNGMERMVKLFHKRSDELQVGVDLDCRASVLVSEILDSELLGEGLIPTLQHAHEKLLTTNPKTVPWRATTYGQLVESTYLWKLHDLHGNEARASDGIFLTPPGLEKIIHVKPLQYAVHLDSLCNELRLLSDPFKIFEFDFWKRPDSYGETEMWINTTNDGKIHAVVSWWVLELDHEGSILYSTAPNWIGPSKTEGNDCWCDHWRQCVWFIPGKGISVSKNTNILFKAIHNGTNMSYFLRDDKEADYCSFNSHDCLLLSPEQIGIYGEKGIRSAFLIAVKFALQRIKLSPLCVVADGSILLTVLAASLSKTSRVISSIQSCQGIGCAYLQAVSDANGFSMDRIQLLSKRASSLLLDDTQTKVDLFMAEPYYYGNEGMLPWQNLRFWKERSMLDPILSKDAIILPCKGVLKACAMYLPDIWRCRCCLTEIEGFDHSVANETLGACGNLPPSLKGACLPYFIWQCGEIKELSGAFSIMDFNFSEPIHACHEKIMMKFSEPGICHGIVLWIDWVMTEENSIVISTGPVSRYWKQGVKLLSKPVEVDAGFSIEIEASFDPFNDCQHISGGEWESEVDASTSYMPHVVGVQIAPSVEYIVAVLSILRCGEAFLPLDPSWPEERIRAIISSSRTRLVIQLKCDSVKGFGSCQMDVGGADWIVDRGGTSVLYFSIKEKFMENVAHATDLVWSCKSDRTRKFCYLMYTSGSTGEPKGVCGTEIGLLNRFWWMQDQFPISQEDVLLFKTAISFVDHLQEFLSAVLARAFLVIPPYTGLKYPEEIADFLKEYSLSRLTTVPSLVRELLPCLDMSQCSQPINSLKVLVLSGEVLSISLWRALHDLLPKTTILNLYGSTEVSRRHKF